MDEPELLEQLEDALLEKLRRDINVPGVDVRSAPDTPDDWTAAAAAGCVLIQYAGARYSDAGPQRLARGHFQRARFHLYVGAPSYRPRGEHVGAYRLLAAAKRAILGSTRKGVPPFTFQVPGPFNEGALGWTPRAVGFFDEMNQVWWYRLEFESSPFVEQL